jgi:hypothetical protein
VDKVPQVEYLNKIESTINESIQSFKDSLFMSVEEGLDRDKNDIPPLVKDYIKSGDVNMYCKLPYSSYPVSLYMAEKHSFSPAYSDTFYSLYWLGERRKGEQGSNETGLNENFMKYLRKEEQDLAIYCLIKSYKNGDMEGPRTLADYFRKGIYFKKDTNMAIIMDFIYEHRPGIRFK